MKECKTPSSFLPWVANNSQIRSEIFSIPISSQHKSTNIQVNLTCKRYEEMYHLLNDGTLVDDHKYSLWKTNKNTSPKIISILLIAVLLKSRQLNTLTCMVFSLQFEVSTLMKFLKYYTMISLK